MSQMVNIPRDVDDPHYRYKMPVLRAKVEGRGNGIKTVVENMSDIAKALERRPDYPTKFFGFELGALTTVETANDRYIVNGKREAEDLARRLDSFISKFVLCGKCRNPETDMHIKGDNILLKCRACGAITPADVSHKLSTYIIKNPPVAAAKTAESKAERKEKRRQAEKESKAADVEDDNDWAVPTTPEAVAQRRLALLGTKDRLSAGAGAEGEVDGDDGEDDAEEKTEASAAEPSSDGAEAKKDKGPDLTELVKVGSNPIPALQKFWASLPSNDEVTRQVRALAEANQWSEANMMKIIFGSLFDKDLRSGFIAKARYLRLFVPSSKQQKIVLYCVEKLCQMDAEAVKVVADMLNGFWEESVLDEETLVKWYKHPHEQMPPKLSQKIRDAAEPFVTWLQKEDDNE